MRVTIDGGDRVEGGEGIEGGESIEGRERINGGERIDKGERIDGGERIEEGERIETEKNKIEKNAAGAAIQDPFRRDRLKGQSARRVATRNDARNRDEY